MERGAASEVVGRADGCGDSRARNTRRKDAAASTSTIGGMNAPRGETGPTSAQLHRFVPQGTMGHAPRQLNRYIHCTT